MKVLVKIIVALSVLLQHGSEARAAEVFITEQRQDGKIIKVFVTDRQADAHLIVYVTKNRAQAHKKDHVWHFTTNMMAATVKINYIEHEEPGCLIVSLTDNVLEAGWRKPHRLKNELAQNAPKHEELRILHVASKAVQSFSDYAKGFIKLLKSRNAAKVVAQYGDTVSRCIDPEVASDTYEEYPHLLEPCETKSMMRTMSKRTKFSFDIERMTVTANIPDVVTYEFKFAVNNGVTSLVCIAIINEDIESSI
jgi:hypothetical protein